MNYQKLFDYLKKEHGAILNKSELEEIFKLVTDMQQSEPTLSALDKSENFNTRLKVATAVISGMMGNNGIFSMSTPASTICAKSIELTDELLKQLAQ